MNSFKSSFVVTFLIFSCFTLSSCEKLFNNAPEIRDQVFSITENSPEGTIIGQVEVSDKAGQDISFWLIKGNEDNIFSIDALKGTLLVNKSVFLDYEAVHSFDLVVRVRDEFGKYTDADITVNLEDILEMEGVILYMPFDGNLNDLSTNSNNGIDYTTGAFIPGVYGQAKEFNGVSDYIQLTNTLDNSKGLSFSFWVNTYGVVETENNGVIIGKYSMAGNDQSFIINSCGVKTSRSTNRIFVKYARTSSVFDFGKSYLDESDLPADLSLWTLNSPKMLTVNQWEHCVVNLTPSHVEIWINGTLCTKRTRSYNTYQNNSDVPTCIGTCLWCGEGENNHFHGVIDELRVYNRSLTQEEISTLYNQH